jgi:hypothetical protein
MFMESLLNETQRLANICSLLDTLKLRNEHGEATGWGTPFAMLQIARSCTTICELATAIAKAGYRECDEPTLNAILAETRQILYSVNARAAA